MKPELHTFGQSQKWGESQIPKRPYKYIPYNPINKPNPQNYFQQAITNLEQQNLQLRFKLNNLAFTKFNGHKAQNINFGTVQQCVQYIDFLQRQIQKVQCDIKMRVQLVIENDKVICDIGSQNQMLRDQRGCMEQQIQFLKLLVQDKNQELTLVKEQAQKPYRTYSQKKTNFSSTGIDTPRTIKEDYQNSFMIVENNHHSPPYLNLQTPKLNELKVIEGQNWFDTGKKKHKSVTTSRIMEESLSN